jgi:hypothetical protein
MLDSKAVFLTSLKIVNLISFAGIVDIAAFTFAFVFFDAMIFVLMWFK